MITRSIILVFVVIVKQILFPCLMKYLCKAMSITDLQVNVFSAPVGINWLYVGFEGLGFYTVIGTLLLWATEWIW